MSVRRFLSLRVRSLSAMLCDVRRGREAATRLNRQERDITAGIVGDEERVTATVDAHITRRAALRRLVVDSRECSGVGRDCEGAHSATRFLAALLDLVHGVERTAIRVDREKGRIRT